MTAALLPIAQRGETVLQQTAQAVPDPQSVDIQQLIAAMHATMLAANGVGIAAPQVFEPLQIIIVASRPNARYPDAPAMEPVVMINPSIYWQSAETCWGEEGCLSVADTRAEVERAQTIRVRYQNTQGEWQDQEYSGFVARIIQHECDHLNGVLFVDRVADQVKQAALA